jgi:hypothetical protein
MAAPIGNQFWKLRSKHGREKIFESPENLWQAAVEYFEATDKRKWIQKDWVGKDAHQVERETDTPYTITGLCLYLDIDEKSFNNYTNKEEYKDFFPIITRIRQIIYTQKFEGATVGAYNANIIARDLGLRDKQEIAGNFTEKKIKKVVICKPKDNS